MNMSFKERSDLPRLKMGTIILMLFSLLSQSLAENGCFFTSSSLSCVHQSGKFLPVETRPDISSLYVIQSDVRALTMEDFAIFESVTAVSIINSTLLFPNHDHLLSVIPDLSVLRIINCNVSEDVSTVFAGTERITQLDLRQNKITALKKEFFVPIKHVQQINLNHNNITSIEVGTFDELTSLRVLNLTENNIGMSFDSAFLTIPSAICVVCREQFGNKDCSSDDFARCKNNDPEDQLWWISTKVTILLEENPICDIITGNMSSKTRIESPSDIDIHEPYSCKVYDQGNCYKHESRRMFFLEACGITEMPASIIAEKKPDDSVVRADNTIPWYVFPLVIVSAIVGTLITVILVKKGIIAGKTTSERPKDKTRSSNTSHTARYSGGEVTVQIEKHDDQDQESQEVDQLITNRKDNHMPTAKPLYTAIEDNRDFPFHSAILSGKSQLIWPFLLDEKLFIVKNRLGDYPIHLAALVNDVKTTEVLLKSRANVDVNIKNNAGNTPLIIAARENNFETLSILLKNEADCSLSNYYGVEPLHLASWNGNSKMILMLLYYGAKINNADKEGKTPLFYATTEGRTETVKLLLKNGANVNDSSHIGRTPLHISSWNNYRLMVDILLEYNADLVGKDLGGYTALHKASRKGHVDVIKKLLSCKKVDINCVSIGGNTPLHQAAKGGHIEAIQLLIENGANAKAKNKKGFTPYDAANERGQIQCLSILK